MEQTATKMGGFLTLLNGIFTHTCVIRASEIDVVSGYAKSIWFRLAGGSQIEWVCNSVEEQQRLMQEIIFLLSQE